MSKSVIISALSSNSGKTTLTTALLYHYKKRVRAFKCGPDYIDPIFHKKITNHFSINLDGYLMNKDQLLWTFHRYKKEINIIEGVMGFYDGMEKESSAYDISKKLSLNSVLVIDGSGSYNTLCALIKGVLEFRKDNSICAVVFNKLSSENHFVMIKNIVSKELPTIKILGWIKKDITTLRSRHLGLDLNDLNKTILEKLSKEVLENIDLNLFEEILEDKTEKIDFYPFEKIDKIDKKIAIVYDKNFSFLYFDNMKFLKESFREVVLINSVKNQKIDEDVDIVYIPGGYVETKEAYNRVKNSKDFLRSLKKHSQTKVIYAECAGLIYLSNKIDDKKMSSILDLNISLKKTRVRLGYYQAYDSDFCLETKGHSFHYSDVKNKRGGVIKLYKNDMKSATVGGWRKDLITGTYLHIFFRTNVKIIRKFFNV